MHTVIGVFDQMPQAQLAREQLQQQVRVAPEHIHVGAGHLGPDGELVNDSTRAREKWENRSALAAFGSFWASLIESNMHEQTLDGALQRGHAVVAVQLQDDSQAAQVAQVLEQCHAIEVQHGNAPVAGADEPQHWHAADDPATGAERTAGRGEPIGTHSFAGHGASVGLPAGRVEAARDRTGAVAEHGVASRPSERDGLSNLLSDRPDANRER